MGKSTTSLETLIIFAFTLIMVIIVITVWIMPKITEALQGKCWADADRAASSIKDSFKNPQAFSQTQKITLGDCVGGIIIFNKNDPAGHGFETVMQDTCGKKYEGSKSFILVIPYKTLSEEARKDSGFLKYYLEWITHPILSFQDVWLQGKQFITRIKPICIAIDAAEFDKAYCIPNGICCTKDSTDPDCKDKGLSDLVKEKLNQVTFNYCFRPVVRSTDNGVRYYINEYSCPAA